MLALPVNPRRPCVGNTVRTNALGRWEAANFSHWGTLCFPLCSLFSLWDLPFLWASVMAGLSFTCLFYWCIVTAVQQSESATHTRRAPLCPTERWVAPLVCTVGSHQVSILYMLSAACVCQPWSPNLAGTSYTSSENRHSCTGKVF